MVSWSYITTPNPPEPLYCAQIAAIFQARIHYLCPWFLLLNPFTSPPWPFQPGGSWQWHYLNLEKTSDVGTTQHRDFKLFFCWSSGSSSSNQCVIEVVKVLEWLTVVWCAFWLSVVLPLFIYFLYLGLLQNSSNKIVEDFGYIVFLSASKLIYV